METIVIKEKDYKCSKRVEEEISKNRVLKQLWKDGSNNGGWRNV
ncbi:MAG: hypothetical protein ACRCX2_21185 [Paraclostridium sp.]